MTCVISELLRSGCDCGPNQQWGTVRPHRVRNNTVQKAIFNRTTEKDNCCCQGENDSVSQQTVAMSDERQDGWGREHTREGRLGWRTAPVTHPGDSLD
jgi:hypothetical protein